MVSEAKFAELVGKVLTKITGDAGSYCMEFHTQDGRKYVMFHNQDCCESVAVEDICGNLEDLIGSPVIMAEEATSGENPEGITKDYQDSFTWTFYRIQTAKGLVTIRWYGESNGYYGESVEFTEEVRDGD